MSADSCCQVSEELASVFHNLIGEICFVTEALSPKKEGLVRIWGSEFPAKAKKKVFQGQWVCVTSHTDKYLEVDPLNVWLGGCGCSR